MRILKKQKGQALVEFAIILPILLLLIMGIVQFGMVINAYLTVQNAAREGARAGIVGISNLEIKDLIAGNSKSLEGENLTIDILPSEENRTTGETLVVKLSYDYKLTVPIINNIFGSSIVLQAQTSMRIE